MSDMDNCKEVATAIFTRCYLDASEKGVVVD